VKLLWLFLTVVAEGFFSGMETGVYSLNRIRLRFRAQEGRRDAARVARMIRDPQMLVCTTLAGTNLATYLTSAIVTFLLAKALPGDYAELATTFLVAPFLLVFAEALPKSLFHAHADKLVYALSWPLRLAWWVLMPASLPLRGVVFVISRLLRKPPEPAWAMSEQRLQHFLTEGAREGVLSAQQDAIARNILRLSGVRVGQVMVPLDQVKMVPAEASFDELRDVAAQGHFSRLPVYEGERRKVVGAVNLIDLLCSACDRNVARHVRPLPRVAPEMPIDQALVQLQKQRKMMAVVADGEGRAVGIITVKDLVEEVVGELREW